MSSILIHFQYVHLNGSRGHDLDILIFYGTIWSFMFQTSCGLFGESGCGRNGFPVELSVYMQRATQEKQLERWGDKPKPSPSLPACTMSSLSIPPFPWSGRLELFVDEDLDCLNRVDFLCCSDCACVSVTRRDVTFTQILCMCFLGLSVLQVKAFYW